MDFIDSIDDPVVFFTDDRDSEIFSRSLTTPIAQSEVLEEDERLRIINEIFGSPAIAAFSNVDLHPGEANCSCDQESKPQKVNGGSFERIQSSMDDGKVIGSDMSVLSRRKSNPFYCPSRQIMDLVSKRRKVKRTNLLKSQSSGAIVTLNLIHGESKGKKRCGAGSSRTGKS
ncbi:hypothetical protein HG537_0B06440 [Torulaspora globosa]|uniref:Uncharacterized protein n=1 Tax=Torulaspora globosa TaxID=48254 RepID=A0A7H9HQ11_9SACH|nr:hypothetical protein HG537_0B06440 [Torulaspora sp. CBS 2947]